jgi:hypothetical protein
MTKADFIREYLEKNYIQKGHSLDTIEKKGLAKVLCTNYPNMFDDVERTRTVIRSVMGQGGKEHRADIKDTEKQKYYGDAFYSWAEHLNGDLRPWDDPFIIPTAIDHLNIIADLHSVWCDKKVVEWFFQTVKNKGTLLINGDLLDSESFSRHLKLHNLIDYDAEIEMTYQFLKLCKQEFDTVYVKEGNHDFWLERYLLNNARELFRLRGLNVKELLKLGELQIPHIHNLQYIKFHDLDIIHGHELPMGFGSKFIAKSYMERWQRFKQKLEVKILASHCHREDAYMVPNIDGTYSYGWVTSAFCRKGAQYSPYGYNTNGYSEAILVDGKVTVRHHRI